MPLVVRGEPLVRVPLMAFWAEPFDQFRSAIAVMPKNGIPPSELAQRTVSHVLMCEEDAAELWLLRADDLKRESRVPLAQLEGLFAAYRGQLERTMSPRRKSGCASTPYTKQTPRERRTVNGSSSQASTKASSQLRRLMPPSSPHRRGRKEVSSPTFGRDGSFVYLPSASGLIGVGLLLPASTGKTCPISLSAPPSIRCDGIMSHYPINFASKSPRGLYVTYSPSTFRP